MPTIRCPQCEQNYDDEELFCPHCGAAQIPQARKADLGRQQAAYRRLPRGAKIGTLIGLALGVVLVIAVGPSLPPSRGAGETATVVIPAVLGGVIGLFVERWRRASRR